MKKFRLFAAILVVALCTTTLTSCNNNRRIVGTWETSGAVVTYYANGTFTQRGSGGTIQGTFVLQQNSLIATTNGWSQTHSIRFIDRNTIILNEGQMGQMTLRRRN